MFGTYKTNCGTVPRCMSLWSSVASTMAAKRFGEVCTLTKLINGLCFLSYTGGHGNTLEQKGMVLTPVKPGSGRFSTYVLYEIRRVSNKSSKFLASILTGSSEVIPKVEPAVRAI